MAAIGTLTYEFQISLPLVARYTFGAGAGGYGLHDLGHGRRRRGRRPGGGQPGPAQPPQARHRRRRVRPGRAGGQRHADLRRHGRCGCRSWARPRVAFISMSNTNLQLAAAPEMRGRVMALYSVAFLGSTPVGGPIVGWVGQTIGPRAAAGAGRRHRRGRLAGRLAVAEPSGTDDAHRRPGRRAELDAVSTPRPRPSRRSSSPPSSLGRRGAPAPSPPCAARQLIRGRRG